MLNCPTQERRYNLFFFFPTLPFPIARAFQLVPSWKSSNMTPHSAGRHRAKVNCPFSLRRRGGDERGLAGDVSIHLQLYSLRDKEREREKERTPSLTPPLICSARRGTSPWQPLSMLPPATGGRQTLYLLNVKVARARMKGRLATAQSVPKVSPVSRMQLVYFVLSTWILWLRIKKTALTRFFFFTPCFSRSVRCSVFPGR